MLPSRPRLEGWNPISLASSAAGISAGGDRVEQAVERISRNIATMPETRAWSGQAHDAAAEMFDRAHTETTRFSEYTDAIARAFIEGAGWIGDTRTALLNKADEIDRGELAVSDQWVVLIKPAPMSAEKVAALMEQVMAEQTTINELLLSVGEADDGTAAKVTAAAQPFGFVAPSPEGLSGMMIPGATKPVDEVPNPSDPVGLFQQGVVRGEEMGMTIRETTEEYYGDGDATTTLTMQDGSKHIIRRWGDLAPHVSDEHVDPNGKLISHATSWYNPLTEVNHTDIEWPDGTVFNATETADGHRTAAFTLPDGRYGVLPPDNPFFTGAVPDVVGGAFTGLEAHTARGKLPMLSMEATENVGKVAQFGGPAVGVLTTIYAMGTAESPYDRCVAGFAGSFEIAGDAAGGAGGALLGTIAPPAAQVVTVPAGAVGGAYVVAEWMKSVGTKVGAAFCQ